ncbi:hypothetical protein ACNTMW_18995 [Planosporangium sp. 12N6]|uniref:hypothetical protein n=1 Tax=Planosporangium spinosum TaxID=3402278 RepID=UPI003CEBB65A
MAMHARRRWVPVVATSPHDRVGVLPAGWWPETAAAWPTNPRYVSSRGPRDIQPPTDRFSAAETCHEALHRDATMRAALLNRARRAPRTH